MNIGDKFWVADYWANNEYPSVFEDIGFNKEVWPKWVKYKCKSLDYPKSGIHHFGDNGSPDVFSAVILKTKEELDNWYKKQKDFEERKELAEEIFPEGF